MLRNRVCVLVIEIAWALIFRSVLERKWPAAVRKLFGSSFLSEPVTSKAAVVLCGRVRSTSFSQMPWITHFESCMFIGLKVFPPPGTANCTRSVCP